jgi:hypothetical protein
LDPAATILFANVLSDAEQCPSQALFDTEKCRRGQALKPRTECCCQPVAFMIAAMVVPFGWRSNASTASCFEEAAASADAGFVATALNLGFIFDCKRSPTLAAPFAARRDLPAVPVAFGFDLLAAI